MAKHAFFYILLLLAVTLALKIVYNSVLKRFYSTITLCVYRDFIFPSASWLGVTASVYFTECRKYGDTVARGGHD